MVPALLPEESRVDQHPYRDEEEHGEDVPQGLDLGEGLVAVVRLGEDHPRDERPEGEREPDEVGRVADPEPYGHDRDQEQLARTPGGHTRH